MLAIIFCRWNVTSKSVISLSCWSIQSVSVVLWLYCHRFGVNSHSGGGHRYRFSGSNSHPKTIIQSLNSPLSKLSCLALQHNLLTAQEGIDSLTWWPLESVQHALKYKNWFVFSCCLWPHDFHTLYHMTFRVGVIITHKIPYRHYCSQARWIWERNFSSDDLSTLESYWRPAHNSLPFSFQEAAKVHLLIITELPAFHEWYKILIFTGYLWYISTSYFYEVQTCQLRMLTFLQVRQTFCCFPTYPQK